MPTEPNVLLIMTDQQRWDAAGCYGNDVVETVNLDWLATQGTVFENAYSATPSCIPARASLLTGMDPWHTGILGMGCGQPPLSGLSNTLPEVLSRAGYHTQGVGKMHFLPQRSLHGFHNTVLDEELRVRDRGFVSDYVAWFDQNRPAECDRMGHGVGVNSWLARPYHLPEYLHATTWTVDESIRFLRRRDPTRPFFLKTSFTRPHSPYDPPEYYFSLYEQKSLPEAAVGDWASVHDVPSDAANPDAWRGRRKPEEVHRARAGYYGSVHHIDHQIGRLMAHLRKSGLDDNTLVIFTSDHGDMLGDHHLWRKTYAYEGSAHIPLIVRPPREMRDRLVGNVSAPVCLQDVMPTALDVCGLPIPETVDGFSLLPLMRGNELGARAYVHGEHCGTYDEGQEMQYLTDGTWKYIWFPRSGAEQLFHLETDPYECRELSASAEHAEQLRRWRERLVGILAKREAGLTKGGELICQDGRPPLVSPHAAERK